MDFSRKPGVEGGGGKRRSCKPHRKAQGGFTPLTFKGMKELTSFWNENQIWLYIFFSLFIFHTFSDINMSKQKINYIQCVQENILIHSRIYLFLHG